MAITKCPNCNNKVSTLAVKCPHCETPVSNNLSYCPECQDAYINGWDTCPNCGFTLNGSPIEPTPTQQPAPISAEPVAPAGAEPQQAANALSAEAEAQTANDLEPITAGNEASVIDNETNIADNESNIADNEADTANSEAIIADSEADETNSESDDAYSETDDEQTGNRRRLSPLAIWLIAIIILIVLCTAGILYYQYYQHKAEEASAYATLQEDFDHQKANAFIATYPDGEYADSVRHQIKQLDIRTLAWNKIEDSIDRNDFAQFLTTYKTGAFTDKAKEKLDSLDWAFAKQDATAESLNLYLSNHIDGKHLEVARQGLNAIYALRPTGTDVRAINATLTTFLKAISRGQKPMLEYVAMPAVVASASKFIDNADKTATIKYALSSPVSIDKDKAGEGYEYSVSADVIRYTTNADHTTVQKTFRMQARINGDYKIVMLGMKSHPVTND